ncbi:MAG TPA: YihY/virulence factor BrkB family protein [Gemmatimonadales bacterium]|nr:YihY/virulence factor BrkB family protein [Gemmatimonadales bacterium]
MEGWHRTIRGFVQRTLIAAGETNVPFLASALTFDSLLAGVPFVLLLLVGVSLFAQGAEGTPTDLAPFLERFLPPSGTSAGNELTHLATNFIHGITVNRGSISLFALILFVWFSTRLFASVRTALNRIYHHAAPAHKERHFLVRMLLNKAWDIVMVGMLLLCFVLNILLSVGLTAAEAWSAARLPGARESVSYLGRFLNVGLGFLFAFVVFTLVYRYASSRPVRWRIAAVSATFTALGVELAKRIFSLYLATTSGLHGISAWGSFTTVILLVLWAYYSAVVFLLGGVVGEIFAERDWLREGGTDSMFAS